MCRVTVAFANAPKLGAVAQLGERLICIQEAAGSIPTSSTMFELYWPAGQSSGSLAAFWRAGCIAEPLRAAKNGDVAGCATEPKKKRRRGGLRSR